MYPCVFQEKVEGRSCYRRRRFIYLGVKKIITMRKLQFFLRKHINWWCECVLTFLCIPIRAFLGVSVLSEPDNKSVRSPCFMIKGLCSLATVFPQKRERNTVRRGREKKHVLSVTARTQYFAIFLRLGLFARSYRWNAFKDNKEIKITFRNPYQGGRKALKVNKGVQLSTISHFPLPPVTASDLA